MADFLIMITTVDSEAVGAKLSRSAVEAGVAASGQVTGPVATTYRHHGEVCEGVEWQVTFRTTKARAAELEGARRRRASVRQPGSDLAADPVRTAALSDWITRATRPAGG